MLPPIRSRIVHRTADQIQLPAKQSPSQSFPPRRFVSDLISEADAFLPGVHVARPNLSVTLDRWQSTRRSTRRTPQSAVQRPTRQRPRRRSRRAACPPRPLFGHRSPGWRRFPGCALGLFLLRWRPACAGAQHLRCNRALGMLLASGRTVRFMFHFLPAWRTNHSAGMCYPSDSWRQHFFSAAAHFFLQHLRCEFVHGTPSFSRHHVMPILSHSRTSATAFVSAHLMLRTQCAFGLPARSRAGVLICAYTHARR